MNEKLITLSLLKEFRNKIKEQDIDDKLSFEDISFEDGEIKIRDVTLVKPLIKHQSLENYITISGFEDLAIDKGFSKLTLDTIKADESFSELIANKDNYLIQHLTKEQIEDLNLDYTKLDKKPIIPSDIRDLTDNNKLILDMTTIKADVDFNELITNKSEFALKKFIPTKVSDLTNDLNFSDITLSDIKSDSDIGELIANKHNYLTDHLTKEEIENLAIDYSKLSGTPFIPADLKDLTDSNSLLLTLDNVKADTDIGELLSNKDKFALKDNLPSKLSDLINDTNFTTLTIEDVKKDEDIGNLVLNKDKFITQQLTKDDIEAMGLNYNNLANTPAIPKKVSELTNDSGFTTFDGDYASLKNQPTLFSGDYSDLSGKPEIPSRLSELTNDAGYSKFDGKYSSLIEKPELFTGDYNDLTNLPLIPSDIKELNDSEKLLLTIDNVKNDEEFSNLLINKDNFALKSNLPSKLSDLDNDTNFTTLADVKTDSELAHKTDIITSYLDLKDKPSIPSDISDLDDSNNIILTLSKIKEDDAFAQLISNKDKYLTEHQDITHLANKQDIIKSYNDLLDTPYIPDKLSDLTNDSNYQTAANVETIISNKGYQTAEDVELSISGKGYKTESDINLIISGKGFQTASDFINALKEKGILNSDGNVSISCDKISGLGLLATKDTLSAQDVGARPNTWTPTAQEVGVPEWARSANKPTYTASEVGARATDWLPVIEDLGIEFDQSEGLSINGIKLDAQHVGAKASTYTPTASEVNSAIVGAADFTKAAIRFNMGLGSLATKSSIDYGDIETALTDVCTVLETLIEQENTRNPGIFSNVIIHNSSFKDKVGLKELEQGIK